MRDESSRQVLIEALFGELSMDDMLKAHAEPDRRELLERLRAAVGSGDSSGARAYLDSLLRGGLQSSREQIWLWRQWRDADGPVSDEVGRRVLGVVIEVGMKAGVDFLGAYADRTARYYNYSGAAVIWETNQRDVDHLIDELIAAAARVLPNIGPWEGPRRPPPQQDVVRLNILTASGLHFGEGEMTSISRDELAGPILMAGTNLMRKLTQLANRP
jgi:hypothetical protein